MSKIIRFLSVSISLALASWGLSLPASSSGALVSQFQAMSPVSFWVAANQPVPAQGSTVTISFDRNDFTGVNAESDYQQALQMSTTATVTYVIADLGYRSWPDVNSIGTAGDLGYLVLLDFGGSQSFSYAYTGYVSFSNAANSYDAVGKTGMYSFTDGGNYYLWAPSTIALTGATGVLSSWEFQTLKSVSLLTNQTLDCSKVDASVQSDCSNLGSLVGTVLALPAGQSFSVVRPSAFIGVAGLTSQISGGLVQTSLVQLPSGSGGNSVAVESDFKYEGPTLDSNASILKVKGQGKLNLVGEKLATVTSVLIDGNVVEFQVSPEGQISISLPSSLQPGVYDLVMKSASGTTTFMNSVSVEAPAKLRSFSLRVMPGQPIANTLAEVANISAMYTIESGKVNCLVNGKDQFEAAELATQICANIRTLGIAGSKKVTSTKSTFTGEGYWVRVYLAG